MTLTFQALCADAVRSAGELSRRDIARGLLAVPAAEALEFLPALRRELTAARNPLSRAFWEHAEALLASIAGGAATTGAVRAWLEATGSEPTLMVAGGFLWPEEDDRGPVAREMHGRLVAHLEGLVAGGAIDPDRLLEGDEEALEAYKAAQVAWLYEPLPDGRQPVWAVSDEEDEEFLTAWDDAEADACEILRDLLAELDPRPCPQADLAAVCARLREELRGGAWPYDLLAAAGGLEPGRLPSDDGELWLSLAAGVVECRGEPPERSAYDIESYAAWFALDHAAWIGAVVALVRAGPGAPADADTLAHLAATFDFEELDGPDGADEMWPEEPWLDADLDDAGYDDELPLQVGFHTVELLWGLLGAVDGDARLTELGWWGLPEGLLHAWQPRE
jgi:hypothetical protein